MDCRDFSHWEDDGCHKRVSRDGWNGPRFLKSVSGNGRVPPGFGIPVGKPGKRTIRDKWVLAGLATVRGVRLRAYTQYKEMGGVRRKPNSPAPPKGQNANAKNDGDRPAGPELHAGPALKCGASRSYFLLEASNGACLTMTVPLIPAVSCTVHT